MDSSASVHSRSTNGCSDRQNCYASSSNYSLPPSIHASSTSGQGKCKNHSRAEDELNVFPKSSSTSTFRHKRSQNVSNELSSTILHSDSKRLKSIDTKMVSPVTTVTTVCTQSVVSSPSTRSLKSNHNQDRMMCESTKMISDHTTKR